MLIKITLTKRRAETNTIFQQKFTPNWNKLNVDGVAKDGLVGTGGVIRYDNGS